MLSLEIGLTLFDPILAEKSESENFTQIWLTRCQTLYVTCENYGIFDKKFRESNGFANKITR